ncbi:MAG: hypothetical protein ACOYMW_11815 [Candidatus Competibacteraceae bacterium]
MKNATEVSLFEGLFLLVQTPRGGEFNHRFLAPPDVDEQFINYAIDHLTDCALVAQRPQAQTSSGRMGQEWIALVGVDKAQMTALEQQNIQRLLDDLLQNELDELIRQTDWGTQPKAITLRFSELTKWRTRFEDRVSSKPLKITNKELIMSNAKRGKKQMIETLLWPSVAGLIVIAATTVTMWPSEQPFSPSERTSSTQSYHDEEFCKMVFKRDQSCKGKELREAVYDFNKALIKTKNQVEILKNQITTDRKYIETLIGNWGNVKASLSSLSKVLHQADQEIKTTQNEIKEQEDYASEIKKEIQDINNDKKILIRLAEKAVQDTDNNISQSKMKLDGQREKRKEAEKKRKQQLEPYQKLVNVPDDQLNGDQETKVESDLNTKLKESPTLSELPSYLEKLEKYAEIEVPESNDQDPPTNQRGSKHDEPKKKDISERYSEDKNLDQKVIDKIRDVFTQNKEEDAAKSLPDLIPKIDFPELKELEDARKALVEAAK